MCYITPGLYILSLASLICENVTLYNRLRCKVSLCRRLKNRLYISLYLFSKNKIVDKNVDIKPAIYMEKLAKYFFCNIRLGKNPMYIQKVITNVSFIYIINYIATIIQEEISMKHSLV